MRKTEKFNIVIMLILTLMMSLLINTVKAAATISSGDTNSTVTITRNVTGVTNNVTNTFGYTITPDNTYNTAGTVTGTPTITGITFSNVAPSAGTATQTGTVDFAGVSFSNVGDYRFILTETSTSDATKYPLDNSTYYLYVSVRYDENDDMVATVAANGIKGSTTYSAGAKTSVVFTSGAGLTYITISKTVTGNMGDKSKYFSVPVTINGATGDTYVVSGGTGSNPATITSGTPSTLQIKHGETITIGLSGGNNQIPIGATYTVSETAETGYTTSIDTVEQSSVNKTTVANPASNATAIVNNYELATLTGVFINMSPYLLMLAVVLVLIVLLKKTKKRSRR